MFPRTWLFYLMGCNLIIEFSWPINENCLHTSKLSFIFLACLIRTMLSQHFNKEISILTEALRTAEQNSGSQLTISRVNVKSTDFFLCYSVTFFWCKVWDIISIRQVVRLCLFWQTYRNSRLEGKLAYTDMCEGALDRFMRVWASPQTGVEDGGFS